MGNHAFQEDDLGFLEHDRRSMVGERVRLRDIRRSGGGPTRRPEKERWN